MARSRRVALEHIPQVKLALQRKKFPSQQALATEMGMARSTINKFLNGEPVDFLNFVDICEKLELDWQAIAADMEDAPPTEAHQVPNTPQEPSEENNSDIDAIVQKVRDKVEPSIKKWCGTMKVLDMERAIELTDIYTNVNILEKLTARRRIGIDELKQNVDPDNFDRFGLNKVCEPRVDALTAVNEHSMLMVWGKPGGGKTTFLKYLAIQCIGGKLLENRVPIFIEIEKFAQSSNRIKLQEFITDILGNCGVTFSQTSELLKHGRLFIILDGLDEVRAEDSPHVVRQIKYFLDSFHKNHFVLSCRIAGQEYSPDFTEVEIADFDDNQITYFANKWFQARQTPNKAKKFIEKLNEDKSTKELANNPLLLTLLCLVFEETAEFPSNRFDLYREAIDVLLVKWDAQREKERRKIYKQLSASGRRDLLSYIAYKTFEQGEYFFTIDDLKKYIVDYISRSPSYAETELEVLLEYSEDVVDSIESQHGLLFKRALGIYSFSHVTFHEYFTARKITFCSDPQEFKEACQKLVNFITKKRWKEVFLRVAERSRPANYIMLLMKEKIDNIIAQDDKLQEFLNWVNQKSISYNNHYKSAAVRAFYLDVDIEMDVDRRLGCVIDFNCTCLFTCASFLTRALKRDLSDTLDIVQREIGLGLTRESEFESDLAIALERVLAINILQRDFNSELDHTLREKLEQLEKLSKESCNDENFKQWWEFNGRDWADRVRLVIVNHHRIGEHYWQNFSQDQKELLRQYYDANILLMECMKSADMERHVRQEIEDTLLLPIAEIEKRKG
jgi:predicted NACHT family NTPase